MKLKKTGDYCLDLFFPPRCVFCGKIIAPGTKICEDCAGDVSAAGTMHCMEISVEGRTVPCVFLYAYQGKVRDSVIRYKFFGEKQSSGFYAQQLAAAAARTIPALSADLVTSVPLQKDRLKERGYDQSELVAKQFAKALGLPYARCLQKIRSNRVQHMLGLGERRRNVKGAYSLADFSIAGKRIFLVDDIVTSGSTFEECCGLLMRGGVESVVCVAIAATPKEQVENSNSV